MRSGTRRRWPRTATRVLVVDNHDSFTYNLVHYLARLDHVEVDVLVNDDPRLTMTLIGSYDALVISPGPGTPYRSGDTGNWVSSLEADTEFVPTLGVCLGHQVIAVTFGGTVEVARQPMHGLVSPVDHDGDELFEGIPTRFDATRYHSLEVTHVPDALQVIARGPDGSIMAVRHRERPIWGVQFHPESMATAYGERLVSNFIDAARRATPDGGPHAVPQEVTAECRVVASSMTCEDLFAAAFAEATTAYWLDSNMDPQLAAGHFSYLGDGSGPLARVVTYDVARRRLTDPAFDGRSEVGIFDHLQDGLDGVVITAEAGVTPPFPFTGGWVGYLTYEMKALTGGETRWSNDYPDAQLLFADRFAVYDHGRAQWYAFALITGECAAEQRAWLDHIAEVLIRRTTAHPVAPPVSAGLAAPLRHGREEYVRMIGDCQTAIRRGDSYEICLTNMISGDLDVADPFALYGRLRARNAAPYGAYLAFPGLQVLSTSPECFLTIDDEGRVESRPIKGTAARGASPDADEAARAGLLASEKERAENLMIVDLVRNDLSRCCDVGSVAVPELFGVRSYPTVHQLVSTIRARLSPGTTAVDCLRACFPGGSMTGAPKRRTMEILDDLEAGPRGVYSGTIGFLSISGAADLAIVIRTLVLRDGRFEYGVGGAITLLSEADAEFEETLVKALPLTRLFDTSVTAEQG